jgi:hypothetical protein
MRWLLPCLLPLAACATARTPTALPLGYTMCGEDSARVVRPYAFIRIDALASEEGAQVIAHEQAHMAAVRMFGSCREYDAFMGRSDNRVRNEARAFCASAVVWSVQTGTSRENAIGKYARWLAIGYPQYGLTVPRAAQLITEVCT